MFSRMTDATCFLLPLLLFKPHWNCFWMIFEYSWPISALFDRDLWPGQDLLITASTTSFAYRSNRFAREWIHWAAKGFAANNNIVQCQPLGIMVCLHFSHQLLLVVVRPPVLDHSIDLCINVIFNWLCTFYSMHNTHVVCLRGWA